MHLHRVMWQNWKPSWDCSSFTLGTFPLWISWASYTACCGRASLGGGKTDQSLVFQKVKESLQTNRVLVHYDPQKELILTRDASQYSVGAVLSHIMPNGSEKPVANASRSLLAAKKKKKYSQLYKEGQDIIFGVKEFH